MRTTAICKQTHATAAALIFAAASALSPCRRGRCLAGRNSRPRVGISMSIIRDVSAGRAMFVALTGPHETAGIYNGHRTCQLWCEATMAAGSCHPLTRIIQVGCVKIAAKSKVCQARASPRCVSASGCRCSRHAVNIRATSLRAQTHRGSRLLDTPYRSVNNLG